MKCLLRGLLRAVTRTAGFSRAQTKSLNGREEKKKPVWFATTTPSTSTSLPQHRSVLQLLVKPGGKSRSEPEVMGGHWGGGSKEWRRDFESVHCDFPPHDFFVSQLRFFGSGKRPPVMFDSTFRKKKRCLSLLWVKKDSQCDSSC